MTDVAAKVIEILKKNARTPPENMSPDTKLLDLEIESLDLAVIVFDIEDTFGIEVPYNANEEIEEFATVGSIIEKVESLIADSQKAA
ncbi:MAG: acyl carrier protein [Hyphomicrobiaceae bacterium]|nr:acyl carrier protein [Hyphomicrobiaceae bacterium]